MNSNKFLGVRHNGQLPDPAAVVVPSDIGDFLEDYIESTESQLDELEQAILRYEAGQTPDQDAAEIRRILHKIKGESGIVGLDEVADFVHEVENAFEELSEDQRPDMLFRFKDWTTTAIDSMCAEN
jgi:chemotaxis protein histidine kinase CheA